MADTTYNNPEITGNPQGYPSVQHRSQLFTWAGVIVAAILVMAVLTLMNQSRVTPNRHADTSRVEGVSPIEPAQSTPNPLYQLPEKSPREEKGLTTDSQ